MKGRILVPLVPLVILLGIDMFKWTKDHINFDNHLELCDYPKPESGLDWTYILIDCYPTCKYAFADEEHKNSNFEEVLIQSPHWNFKAFWYPLLTAILAIVLLIVIIFGVFYLIGKYLESESKFLQSLDKYFSTKT